MGSDDNTPRGSDKPTYVQELEQRLEAKDAELRETIARYREASNEFDEMRARLRRDLSRDAERSRRLVLADLLEVIDNLDRAIEAARAAQAAPALLQGVEMVRLQFLGEVRGTRRDASGLAGPAVRSRAPRGRDDGARAGPGARTGWSSASFVKATPSAATTLRPAMVAVGRFSNEGASS